MTPLARLSVFADHFADTTAQYITVTELAEMAAAPRVGAKKEAPLITPFESAHKRGEHAQAAMYAAVVIDHDTDNKTEAGIRTLYGAGGLDVCYLAFTSSHHQQEKGSEPAANRWKVIVPFARPVEAETAAELSAGIACRLASDSAQARKQQGFYAPSKLAADAPYIAITDRLGEPWEWLQPDDADSAFIREALLGWEALEQERQAKARQAIPKPRPASVNASAGIVGLILASYDLAYLLAERGYKRRGSRYLSPWSSSGIAGVVLLERDGKQVVYSHHGDTDPLSALNHEGHALDVADVLCALQYGGDYNAMIREEAAKLDPAGQKQRQREYMQAEEQQEAAAQPQPVNVALFDPAPPLNLFGKLEPPALPLDLLPDAIAGYAQDQGELIGADPAAMAMFSLAVAAACIHDDIRIQPKRHDPTWTESARLWVGVIGDPSTKKSPLLKKAAGPAYSVDSRWRKAHNKALVEWEKACKEAKSAKEEEPPLPVGKRLIVEDVTTAKLQDILAAIEPRGVLVIRDELSGWLGSMDAYKNGAGSVDKPAWLEFYNGGPKVFDRVARGSGYVDNWSGCVVGGIQPSVIRAYANAAEHDGLLQRFMLLHAGTARQGQDRPPCEFARLDYGVVIEHLAELSPSSHPVTLSEAAHQHREDLDAKIHALMTNHHNLFLTAALGKWSGLFARLLLTIHCIETAIEHQYPTSRPVSGETAEKVAELMWRILLPHAAKFYESMDPYENPTKDLARLILAKDWSRFTVKRDFSREWKASRSMKPWEIKATLERLEGFNWIAPDAATGLNADGLPKAYFVNPEVHQQYREQAAIERQRRAEVAATMAELSA